MCRFCRLSSPRGPLLKGRRERESEMTSGRWLVKANYGFEAKNLLVGAVLFRPWMDERTMKDHLFVLVYVHRNPGDFPTGGTRARSGRRAWDRLDPSQLLRLRLRLRTTSFRFQVPRSRGSSISSSSSSSAANRRSGSWIFSSTNQRKKNTT